MSKRVIQASLPVVSDRHPCRASGERYGCQGRSNGEDMHKWECPDRGMIPIARSPAKRDPGGSQTEARGGRPGEGRDRQREFVRGGLLWFPGGPRPLSIHPDGRWKPDHSVDYGDTIPPLPGAGVMKGGLIPGAAPKRLGPGPTESGPSGTVLSPRGCGIRFLRDRRF